MRTRQEDNRLLASLAVFRELYNAEKDVYGVISIFLSDLIKTNNLYQFNLTEITYRLNEVFEFEIPEAVVRTSLSRLDFLEKTKTDYLVTDVSKIKYQEIDSKQRTILSDNETIVDDLYNFIEAEQKISLTNAHKEKISHSFCNFLLDNNSNNDEYIEYITAFILKNEENTSFKNQLNLIREGVILYSGIKFNNNLNDLGTWRTELTIYIETEILFHLAGFNGELYKSLANDFLTYVLEINQKAKKEIIKLKYFKEVKIEIEGFFTKAMHLLKGRGVINPSITAMVSIINGCKSQSDILEKKSDFYSLLKSLRIEEDTYEDYFNPINYKYNIVSEEVNAKISRDFGLDAEGYLNFLNYISIQRKEANLNNFENIGSILLSGNSITLKIAWNYLVKDEGAVPLATHLSFLTNKFWFKLNKGFGKNVLPKSFNVISKAQIILSKILNESVGEKYTELQGQYKNGALSEEQVKARIIDLRNQARRPEEIKNDLVTDVLHAITEDSLEKFVREESYAKIKAEKQQKDYEKAQIELENKKDIEKQFLTAKEELLQEKLKAQIELENKKDIEKELLITKEALLQEKIKAKVVLEAQKKRLDEKSKSKYFALKMYIGLGVATYYIALIACVYYFTWNEMEQVIFFLGIIPLVFSVFFSLINEQTINPLAYLRLIKNEYVIATYEEFGFDRAKLEEVEISIHNLTNEINSIKRATP